MPSTAQIPTRNIGSLTVSAVSLGCMNLSHAYGVKPDEQSATKLLNQALDMGVTMLDTAALYGMGENEKLIGKAVGHRRSDFTLASKCGLFAKDGKRTLDASPAAIGTVLDAALERLGTDHIDLYYLHRLDAAVPIEESVGALVRAKEAGKISHIGLSEMSAGTIRRAHAVHPITAVQSEYSAMVRNVEVAVLEACEELGIGLVAFSPLARGMLADAIRDADYAEGDIRTNMPRFVEPQLSHNLESVRSFKALARELDLAPATLALCWVLARKPFTVPIPGTRSLDHLKQNIAAASVAMDPDIGKRIDAIFADGAIRGPRYSAKAQTQIDTETLPGEELAAE